MFFFRSCLFSLLIFFLCSCEKVEDNKNKDSFVLDSYCALGASTAALNWQKRVANSIAKSYNCYAINSTRWVHTSKTVLDYSKNASNNPNNLVMTNQLARLLLDKSNGYNPNFITIMCGLNDAALGGATIVGSYDDAFAIDMSTISVEDWCNESKYQKLRETVYGSSRFVIENLVRHFPNAKIVILVPQYCNVSPYTTERIKPVVEAVKVVAKRYSIEIIDIFKESKMQTDDVMNTIYLRDDKIHPNNVGEQILYDYMVKKIYSIYNKL